MIRLRRTPFPDNAFASQNEIDRLKKEIEQKKISETPLIEEEEEDGETSAEKKVSVS